MVNQNDLYVGLVVRAIDIGRRVESTALAKKQIRLRTSGSVFSGQKTRAKPEKWSATKNSSKYDTSSIARNWIFCQEFTDRDYDENYYLERLKFLNSTLKTI